MMDFVSQKENTFSKLYGALNRFPFATLGGPTGSGKSSIWPYWLALQGCKVIVAVPLQSAAISLARRIGKMLGCGVGERVAYRTGLYHSSNNWREAQVLCVTTGWLETYMFHNGSSHFSDYYVILDEFHKGDDASILSLGWIHDDFLNGAPVPKTVLTSATQNNERLADYLPDAYNASIPGKRPFHVETMVPQNDFLSSVLAAYERGGSVLAFQPSKARIYHFVDCLKALGLVALPFHGQLPGDAIQQVVNPDRGKVPDVVVSSSAGACSHTFNYLKHVVSSGLQREVYREGVSQWFRFRPSTEAEMLQELGRVGRVSEGTFTTQIEPQGSHPPFEIEYECPERFLLRLRARGSRMPKLLASPRLEGLDRAKSVFCFLGMNEGRSKCASEVGLQPRTFVIAEGVPMHLRSEAICMAVVLEMGGLGTLPRQTVKGGERSDLFAYLKIFCDCLSDDAMLETYNVKEKDWKRALKVFKKLCRYWNVSPVLKDPQDMSSRDQQDLLSALVKGFADRVVDVLSERKLADDHQIGAESGVQFRKGHLVFGLRRVVEADALFANQTSKILSCVSTVSWNLWENMVGDALEASADTPYYDVARDDVYHEQTWKINGRSVRRFSVKQKGKNASLVFLRWLVTATGTEELLNSRYGEQIQKLSVAIRRFNLLVKRNLQKPIDLVESWSSVTDAVNLRDLGRDFDLLTEKIPVEAEEEKAGRIISGKSDYQFEVILENGQPVVEVNEDEVQYLPEQQILYQGRAVRWYLAGKRQTNSTKPASLLESTARRLLCQLSVPLVEEVRIQEAPDQLKKFGISTIWIGPRIVLSTRKVTAAAFLTEKEAQVAAKKVSKLKRIIQ